VEAHVLDAGALDRDAGTEVGEELACLCENRDHVERPGIAWSEPVFNWWALEDLNLGLFRVKERRAPIDACTFARTRRSEHEQEEQSGRVRTGSAGVPAAYCGL